jgi:hypothetical protein
MPSNVCFSRVDLREALADLHPRESVMDKGSNVAQASSYRFVDVSKSSAKTLDNKERKSQRHHRANAYHRLKTDDHHRHDHEGEHFAQQVAKISKH